MSTEVAKPWALLSRHAGWADILRIESEAGGHVTDSYPDRESDERVTYNTYAVLARFATQECDARGAGACGRRGWLSLRS